MKYKLLGRSGLRVSELSLGTMTFGTVWEGMGADKKESRRIFDAYCKAGGNFIDTANKYMEGVSEEYVGEFVAGERDRFVLATKYTLSMDPGDPNGSGNHRKNLRRSVEASLKRLDTDYIDLLWVHMWDAFTPIEETMRALDDLVRSGKVLYVGISDMPAWMVSRANTMADLKGWSPFIGLQINYSLLERTVERELLPMAKELDLGVTPWAPIGGGVLTGKYNEMRKGRGNKKTGKKNPAQKNPAQKNPGRYDPTHEGGARLLTERNFGIADTVMAIAKRRGKTPAQVALNWVRAQDSAIGGAAGGERGVIVPIIGARTVEQVKDNLGALKWKLTKKDLAELDEASRVELGFPHDFLNMEVIKNVVYGSTLKDTDNHRGG